LPHEPGQIVTRRRCRRRQKRHKRESLPWGPQRPRLYADSWLGRLRCSRIRKRREAAERAGGQELFAPHHVTVKRGG
jgi:hypothetical protein